MTPTHKVSWLSFEATPRCSLKCYHCYNIQKSVPDYPRKILSTDATIDLLKTAIQETGCEHVVLTGGEVYTRPDVNDLILALEQNGIKSIHIMTNGSFLDAEKIAFAKAHKVTLFELSFISADKQIFDEQSRAKDFSAFDNAIYATQELIKQNVCMSHIFVATRKNIHTLTDTLNLSYALGVRNFSFNRFNPCGHSQALIDELQLSPVELTEGLEICEKFAISHPDMAFHAPINIPPCLVDLKKFKHIETEKCGVGLPSIITMDYVGNIRLCTFSSTIIGNIRNMTLSEMFETKKTQDFIHSHPAFCTPCKFLKQCQGGCKASGDSCFGSVCHENPFLAKYKTKPIT